jgi:hypothetical protein
MRKISTILIALAMVFAFVVPAMGQDVVCEPCTKCLPTALGCPTTVQAVSTCVYGDTYDVFGLDAANLPWLDPCPVVFDICDCPNPNIFHNGGASATVVGIRMRLLVNGQEGDNGVYFSENYTGNMVMSNSKTFLCNPACTRIRAGTDPASYYCDTDNDTIHDIGETTWKSAVFPTVPQPFIYYRYSGGAYVAGATPSGACPSASLNRVVQIMSGPGTGYTISAFDETYQLSHWALDIPGIIVNTSVTQCSTISVQIDLMTGAAGICAECASVCSCVYDLYTVCCLAGTGCMFFPYVVATGAWDTGIAISKTALGAPPAADMQAVFNFLGADGTMSTWTDTAYESNAGQKAYAFSTGILPNLTPAPTSTAGSLLVNTNFPSDGMLYLTNGVFGAAHLPRCCTGGDYPCN